MRDPGHAAAPALPPTNTVESLQGHPGTLAEQSISQPLLFHQAQEEQPPPDTAEERDLRTLKAQSSVGPRVPADTAAAGFLLAAPAPGWGITAFESLILSLTQNSFSSKDNCDWDPLAFLRADWPYRSISKPSVVWSN